ncbi:BREX-1 system adenine-specific DNA-methyltransferase PglX [Methylicorpusculum sp.]|uniref:BREX-1 system adenine-specific DNA-methyltransferase PglX n=1 Tax=Methylicorpusculum sp. TaxID=2713644 RepID=UPI002726D184|nr:BREX-1 system adenine-specific DNA-methyltransferase PglX [Methylicorpusculum sp.]MDO8843847.1 BREX-1 system adenine-specific DNA-methyltransferase PglX [Methylicorpusculum sp.]
METAKLKRFAQYARRSLKEQIETKLKQVLAEDSAARRESGQAIKKLERAIHDDGKDQVIERVAYTWFNRFCALRFMDLNRYNRVGIVSPADPGQFQPEILAEAKMGHIDEEMVHDKIRQQIFSLLDGKVPSRDPQGEAYRLLVVAACNYWNKSMPFLFQRIEDYTELLMPDDLLSGNSILAYTRESMTPDTCQNVEVIGWLYQFYISEKKDAVIGKVVQSEDIPAATQLFTPNWIVKYLVQNSIGRLWLMANPHSHLKEKCHLDYYIQPAEQSPDVQEKLNALIQSRIALDGQFLNPETLTVLDPACGSGHILVEAYDILKGIYEEQGYEPKAIPRLILEKNLYGLDIDDRAAQLAAFALMMKARADDRRIFVNPPKLNILSLQSTEKLNLAQLWHKLDLYKEGKIGATSSLFEEPQLNLTDEINRQEYKLLAEILPLFVEAKTFGSLIQVPTKYEKPLADLLAQLENLEINGDSFQKNTAKTLQPYLQQAHILAMKFDAVVANPPYMGNKYLNPLLKDYLKKHYKGFEKDLFSASMIRNLAFAKETAQLGFMSPFVWMFISSYEELRTHFIDNATLTSLIQLEYSGFDGATVPICTFTLDKTHIPNYTGSYIKLSDFKGHENQAPKTIEAIKNSNCGWFYNAKPDDFKKISGSPVAYWVSDDVRNVFAKNSNLNEIANAVVGLQTGSNERFIRLWHEVKTNLICFGIGSREEAKNSSAKWFPYNKGGECRKWYGNQDFIVNWKNDGEEIRNFVDEKGKLRSRPQNIDSYFHSSVSWSDITSGIASFRYFPNGFIYDVTGMSAQSEDEAVLMRVLAFCNSKVVQWIAKTLNPTMHFQVGNYASLPALEDVFLSVNVSTIQTAIELAKTDWNNYETSWDFTENPLIRQKQPTLKAAFEQWQTQNRAVIDEMQRLEEENNRLFIEAYGLQDELSPDVPIEQITLVRADREKDCRDFISYAVGCLFGRYSLDKTGLILASQGETLEDYLKQIPEPTLTPCENNVLPILDGDWFSDDLSERFREFLRVSFGEKQYEENQTFIEASLGKKIGQYFIKDFYNDHIKRYKKRPIYWLFSSPKGSFNALIYMHRYRPDTVSVVLNDYLREFRTKLTAHKNHLEAVSISASATQSEKTKALKEIEKINKIIAELAAYEREVLYPLATQQIDIDLDDGVKVKSPPAKPGAYIC